MLITAELLDEVARLAEASPRGRMNYDLRTQAFEPVESGWKDGSQRMLNVLTPGTVIPVHRHVDTSETVICIRGAVEEVFFDAQGNETEHYVLRYGSDCCAIQVPRGMYHTCRCLEPGSVIFEAKDRPYDPVKTEDILEVKS